MPINDLLGKIDHYILNPLILLVFAIATLMFVVGIVQFISSAGSDNKRYGAKERILYGLIGMFIMFSAYGLIHLILATFGIQGPSFLNQ